MGTISSHQDHRRSKMRVLFVSALLACATAAPSGLLAPVAVPVAYSALPTISPGDIQAAAIDAQVQAQDQAIAAVDKARELTELAAENLNERVVESNDEVPSSDDNQAAAINAQVQAQDQAIAAADKARELSEQATVNLNDKVFESNDQIKEKVVEQFWSIEDKKWQALDAVKTAEAQIDGSVASNADALAKSAVAGRYFALAPNVALANVAVPNAIGIAPVAPVSPILYTPGFVGPVLKATEEKKEEAAVPEPALRTEEAKQEENKDAVAVEAAKPETAEAKPLAAASFVPLLAYNAPSVGVTPVLGVAPVLNGLQTIGLPAVYNAPAVYKKW